MKNRVFDIVKKLETPMKFVLGFALITCLIANICAETTCAMIFLWLFIIAIMVWAGVLLLGDVLDAIIQTQAININPGSACVHRAERRDAIIAAIFHAFTLIIGAVLAVSF